MQGRLVTVFAVTALVLLSGCISRTSADPERMHADPVPLEWPQRNTDGLDALVTSTPFVEHEVRNTTAFFDGRLAAGTIETTVGVWRAERAGTGVVREVEAGWCLFPTQELSSMLQFVCPMPTEFLADLPAQDPGSATAPLEIVDFRVSMPRSTPRGIVVHLASFGAPEEEAHVIDALRERNWLVISSEFPWCVYRPFSFDESHPVDFQAILRAFAARMDARLAVWGDATQAVVEYVRRRMPDIPHDTVVLGFSAGAIGGPTVAARLGEQVRAAVFAGGGANEYSIARRSELDAFEARPPDWMTGFRNVVGDDDLEAGWDEDYLRESRLDPDHAARALPHVPVLLVDARFDHVVPPDSATLLWERLGRPERWTVFGGHSILFWRLPALASDIADWIDRVVPEEVRW